MTKQRTLHSLWIAPRYGSSNRELRKAFTSRNVRGATVEAFSRKTDRLVLTIELPALSFLRTRRLMGMKANTPIRGYYSLTADQLSKIQRLVECELDSEKFEYFIDLDCVERDNASLRSVESWRDMDATLRRTLRRFHGSNAPSKAALDAAYLRLYDKIRDAHLSTQEASKEHRQSRRVTS